MELTEPCTLQAVDRWVLVPYAPLTERLRHSVHIKTVDRFCSLTITPAGTSYSYSPCLPLRLFTRLFNDYSSYSLANRNCTSNANLASDNSIDAYALVVYPC